MEEYEGSGAGKVLSQILICLVQVLDYFMMLITFHDTVSVMKMLLKVYDKLWLGTSTGSKRLHLHEFVIRRTPASI